MSMNETKPTVFERDDFDQTIEKLKAMADLLPRALTDGEGLCRDTGSGIRYIMDDIVKEMEQFSQVVGDRARDRLNEREKRFQFLADELAENHAARNVVAA